MSDINYVVTIAGTAFVTDPTTGVKGVKPYEVEVVLDKKTVDEMGALSPFCKFWAPDHMPVVLPGYQGLQTHQVIKTVTTTGTAVKDIRLMNVYDMMAYIKDREHPIEVELFKDDPEKLRQAITDYEQEPSAFLKTQARSMQLYGKNIETKNRIKALNVAPKAKEVEVAKHKAEVPELAKAAPAAKSKGKDLGI